jgi:small lipoprotein (TIGR04454 family)
MKKVSLSILKIILFLLTAIVFSGHNYAQAEEKPVVESLVTINLEDQDFTQALKAIADQAGITINIHGQIPAGKRDLSLKQVPLNQALAQVLRIYGVLNHAAAYNPDTGTVMLAILETSTMMAALSPQAQPRIDISLDEPLTPEQLERLKEQSEIIVAEMEESALPLAPFQIEQLREQSSAMEKEMEEASQPLTPEQLERLREQSMQIELEIEEASKPLTPEQMKRLREQSRQQETEVEEASRPLTPEQLERLREQSALIEAES